MLNKALELAKKISPTQKYLIAAVITDKRGRVLSAGINSYTKTHSTQAYYAKKVGRIDAIFLHAEMDCLIQLRKQGHTIHIARVDKNKNIMPVHPCIICQAAILDAGIKKIIHT